MERIRENAHLMQKTHEAISSLREKMLLERALEDSSEYENDFKN